MVCSDLGPAEAEAVADRARTCLAAASMTTPSVLVWVSASVGMAWTGPGGTLPAELVAQADAAMDDAKSRWNARRGGVRAGTGAGTGAGTVPVQDDGRSSLR